MFPYNDLTIALGNTAFEAVIIPAEIIKELRTRVLIGIYSLEVKLEVFVRTNKRIPTVLYWKDYSIRAQAVDTFDDSDIRSVLIIVQYEPVIKTS